MNIPDNYDLWEAHEARQKKQLEALPHCDECGEPIQDDFYFEINDTIMCECCLIRDHRKRTEDFVA